MEIVSKWDSFRGICPKVPQSGIYAIFVIVPQSGMGIFSLNCHKVAYNYCNKIFKIYY